MLFNILLVGTLAQLVAARSHSEIHVARSLPSGWQYTGCMSDDPSNRLLSLKTTSDSQTVLGCVDNCSSKGYKYAGLQYGSECWCGSTLNSKTNSKKLADSSCTKPCSGWASSKCGGNYAFNLYTNPSASSKPPSKPPSNPPSSGGGKKGWTSPGRFKAGIAGGNSYPWMEDYIGWWYDWTANPHKPGTPTAVPMLWGDSGAKQAAFRSIKTPKYVLGFEEPDCVGGSGSADISINDAARVWNSLIGPLKAKGTLLGSPSMCHQAAEKWLGPFQKKIKVDWDFTAIHINKVDKAGVLKDIDYYWNTYKKPIWVTEFACVDDDHKFKPCTNQGQINNYINMIVDVLEHDDRVHAYAYSNGLGLGNVWPDTYRDGSGKLHLSASGQTYLNAIKKYAH